MNGETTVDDGEDRRVIGRGDERSVVTVDPCESELWSSLVAERGSSVFVSPPWLRVLARWVPIPNSWTLRMSIATRMFPDKAHNPF